MNFPPFVMLAILPAALGIAQSAADSNEGLRLSEGSYAGTYELSWWGKLGRTYFVQYSEDLVSPWSYMPIIEAGNDARLSYGFTNNAPRFFFRLKFSEQAASNPNDADFDGDGVSNWEELQQGTDPFVPLGPRLAITWPTEGTTIYARTADVYGTWGAISNLRSLTLNGSPVQIASNTWGLRAMPLLSGLNTITLRSIDSKGVETILTRTFNAEYSPIDQPPIALTANVTEGSAPLTVTFDPILNISGTIQEVTYYFDGLNAYPNGALTSSVGHTYQSDGIYYPVVTVKLTNGACYSSGGQLTPVGERLKIKVGPIADSPIQAWKNFTHALNQQDFAAIRDSLGVDKREAWSAQITSMGPAEASQLAADMANLEEVITLGDVAQYSVTISTPMGVLTFPVNFIKESGEWKVDEF